MHDVDPGGPAGEGDPPRIPDELGDHDVGRERPRPPTGPERRCPGARLLRKGVEHELVGPGRVGRGVQVGGHEQDLVPALLQGLDLQPGERTHPRRQPQHAHPGHRLRIGRPGRDSTSSIAASYASVMAATV